MMLDNDYYRDLAQDNAMDGTPTDVIRLQAPLGACDHGPVDGDGGMVAEPAVALQYGTGESVQAVVPHDADPLAVARILREFADFLEEPRGRAVTKLLAEDIDYGEAYRMGTNTIAVIGTCDLLEGLRRPDDAR